MRVSEMISVQVKDAVLGDNGKYHLRINGKGRKERTIPLWRKTTEYLADFIVENNLQENNYLLSGRNVKHLTRSGVRYRIDYIVKRAIAICPSLKNKTVTPHVFRHTIAMSLLQSGVDISTIAIWLGHESIETTHRYMVADIKLKEEALNKVQEPESSETTYNRYQADDRLLQFLKSL